MSEFTHVCPYGRAMDDRNGGAVDGDLAIHVRSGFCGYGVNVDTWRATFLGEMRELWVLLGGVT